MLPSLEGISAQSPLYYNRFSWVISRLDKYNHLPKESFLGEQKIQFLTSLSSEGAEVSQEVTQVDSAYNLHKKLYYSLLTWYILANSVKKLYDNRWKVSKCWIKVLLGLGLHLNLISFLRNYWLIEFLPHLFTFTSPEITEHIVEEIFQ